MGTTLADQLEPSQGTAAVSETTRNEELLERIKALVGRRDWQVKANGMGGLYDFTYSFVLHQGRVVRLVDENPKNPRPFNFILKKGKFYSLIRDYEDFRNSQVIPLAYIETDEASIATDPSLKAAFTTMQESFPLHRIQLFLEDKNTFLSVIDLGPYKVNTDATWRLESADMYVRNEQDFNPYGIPQVVKFIDEGENEPQLSLEFHDQSGYATTPPKVHLSFTPLANLDEALRFPPEYVKVER